MSTKKILVVGRTTTPKVISEKMSVVSLASGEKETTAYSLEIKLIGKALETFNSNGYDKGASLAIYCEETTETYTSKGEEKEKTVLRAQSIYTPILAAGKKVVETGKQFIAGFLTTPKVISPKLTVVRVAVGKEDPEFKEIKLTGPSLAAFNEAGIGKGQFVAFSVNPSYDKFTPKTGENAGTEVSRTVYFAKSLFAPVFANSAGTDQDVPF